MSKSSELFPETNLASFVTYLLNNIREELIALVIYLKIPGESVVLRCLSLLDLQMAYNLLDQPAGK